MKLNITVDLEDLMQDMLEDESCDIQDALKGQIISQVIRTIQPKMQERIDKQLTERIDSILAEKIGPMVDKTMSKAIDNHVIVKNGTEVSLTDHINDMFVKNTGWSNPINKIERLAKDFGVDMKNQYNTIFASKIVENMKNQGMLKDDVAKILLGDQ